MLKSPSNIYLTPFMLKDAADNLSKNKSKFEFFDGWYIHNTTSLLRNRTIKHKRNTQLKKLCENSVADIIPAINGSTTVGIRCTTISCRKFMAWNMVLNQLICRFSVFSNRKQVWSMCMDEILQPQIAISYELNVLVNYFNRCSFLWRRNKKGVKWTPSGNISWSLSLSTLLRGTLTLQEKYSSGLLDSNFIHCMYGKLFSLGCCINSSSVTFGSILNI